MDFVKQEAPIDAKGGPAPVTNGDVDRQIETLRQCKIIAEKDVELLCLRAKEILMEEENVHHGARRTLPSIPTPIECSRRTAHPPSRLLRLLMQCRSRRPSWVIFTASFTTSSSSLTSEVPSTPATHPRRDARR